MCAIGVGVLSDTTTGHALTGVETQSAKYVTGLIEGIRHAIDPSQDIVARDITADERYQEWLTEQETAGVTFTPEQRKWLDAIKDHIANSLAIDQDDFDDVPFSQMGGLGKAHQLFGDRLMAILKDLNDRLAA